MKLIDDLLVEKGLPCAMEAEQIVLASAMMGGEVIENVAAALRANDFFTEPHRRIFRAMVRLREKGLPVDRVTVVEDLTKVGQLESVGGVGYLVSLDEGMPRLPSLDAYIGSIRDTAILREAVRECLAFANEFTVAADPTPEMLARAEATIAALSARTRSASTLRTPLEVINSAGGIVEFLNPDGRNGIATPWPPLNRMLANRGLMPGQMVVIGARPSMGKTALACQIADHAATNGTGVAFFTLEMSADAILRRMASARAQVNALRVTQGQANELERETLSDAYADLSNEAECRLWIDDSTGCTVPAMRAALRRLIARHPVGLVVIDYLQLVETSGRAERRYEAVSEISRNMKRLAREFNVPVVVLAQLNREMDKESRQPRPSDLRDSGSIEQDADVILMPARREGQSDEQDIVQIDLLMVKQRNGPRCTIPLTFLRKYAKFIEPQQTARIA